MAKFTCYRCAGKLHPLRTRCGICGHKVSRARQILTTLICWVGGILLAGITIGVIDFAWDSAHAKVVNVMRMAVFLMFFAVILSWRMWINRRLSRAGT